MPTDEKKHLSMPPLPGIPTVAGSCARVLMGHPFDTIAKKAQVQQGVSNYASILRNLKENADHKKGLKKFMAFYPGFPIAVLYKGTQLTLFEWMSPWRDYVKKHINSPLAADLTAGSSMAILQTTCLQPLNVFKTRLQVNLAGYTWAAFKSDISSGLGATYGRNVVFLGTTAITSTELEKLMLTYYPDDTSQGKLTAIQKEKNLHCIWCDRNNDEYSL